MTRSYQNIGLTAREKEVWPPKGYKVKKISDREVTVQEESERFFETVIVGTFVLLIVLFVAVAVFMAHQVHADEDTNYCYAWANGSEVIGATDEEIYEYCSNL